MTDHLEPYRRMVRSIRFVPSLGRTQPSHQQVTSSPPTNSWQTASVRASEIAPAPAPPLNHSEHIAALVREAVSKPTVLPVSHATLENIGDRISRLAVAKPVTHVISQPKIPEPDPNWQPATVVTPVSTEPAEAVQVDAPVEQQVTAKVEVETQPSLALDAAEEKPADTPVERQAEAKTEVEAAPVETQPSLPLEAAEEKPLADAPVAQQATVNGVPTAKVEREAAPAETQPSLAPDAAEEKPADAAVTPVSTKSVSVALPDESVEQEATANGAPMAKVEREAAPAETQPSLALDAESISVALADEPVAQEATANGVPTAKVEREAVPPETQPSLEPDAAEDKLLDLNSAASVVEQTSAPTTEPEDAHQQVIEAVPDALNDPLEHQNDSAAPLEPTFPTDGEASDKEAESQIQCPKCESTHLKKNGHYKGKQKYACKDCGKKFVLSDSVEKKTAEQTKINTSASTAAQTDSKSSGKKKAKGFGRS